MISIRNKQFFFFLHVFSTNKSKASLKWYIPSDYRTTRFFCYFVLFVQHEQNTSVYRSTRSGKYVWPYFVTYARSFHCHIYSWTLFGLLYHVLVHEIKTKFWYIRWCILGRPMIPLAPITVHDRCNNKNAHNRSTTFRFDRVLINIIHTQDV